MATYKIITIGDSITDTGGTWGSVPGVDPQLYMTNQTRVPGGALADYWAKKMEAWLASAYPNDTFTWVNLARSGYSTYDFGPGGDQRLIAPTGGLNADFAIYFLGINDEVYGGALNDGNYTLTQQAADLDWIVARLPSRGVVCSLFPILSGAQYWNLAWWPSGNPGYSNAACQPFGNQAVSKILAAKPNWKYADLYTPLVAIGPPFSYYNTIDGLHPGILGQQAIWDIVRPKMMEMLAGNGAVDLDVLLRSADAYFDIDLLLMGELDLDVLIDRPWKVVKPSGLTARVSGRATATRDFARIVAPDRYPARVAPME